MRLTAFTDLAMRMLLIGAANKGDRFTIDEANAVLKVSRSHLTKVVSGLSREGFLSSVRGPGGGLRLSREPSKVNLGDVVRAMEPDFHFVECMRSPCECTLTKGCLLPPILNKALDAFLSVLDQHTLADIQLSPNLIFGPGED